MNEKPFEPTVNLRTDDNLQLVIRAHLHTETLLYAMLTERLHNADAIDLDRLNFLTKARLAITMGLFEPDVLSALTALNTLRNNFAHKFNYQFTDQDKQDLLNAIPNFG